MPPEGALDDVPGLQIIADVSERVHALLYDKHIVNLRDAILLTRYLAYSDAFAEVWSEYFFECELRGVLPPMFEMDVWQESMRQEWRLFVKAYSSRPDMFMPIYRRLTNDGAIPFRSMNPAWFVKQMLRAGRFAIIDGEMDTGKTENAVLLCEILAEVWEDYERRGNDSDLAYLMTELKGERVGAPTDDTQARKVGLGLYYGKGIRFVSNVEVPAIRDGDPTKPNPYHKYFQFVPRLSDFGIRLCQNAAEGLYSVAMLDEMGFSWNRKRSTSKHNIEIDGMFRFIRKLNCSVILITQNAHLDFPEWMRRPERGAKTIIEKMGPTVAIYTIQGVSVLNHKRVKGIPKSRIEFSTKAVASFSTDIDLRLVVESVELEKATARAKSKVPWSDNDTYYAMIRAIEQFKILGDLSGSKNPITRQKVIAQLQKKNPTTGELYTPEEIADELRVPLAMVEEVSATLGEIPEVTPEAEETDTIYVERVEAFLKIQPAIPDKEIARLAGVAESFVVQVREAKSLLVAQNAAPADPATPSLGANSIA